MPVVTYDAATKAVKELTAGISEQLKIVDERFSRELESDLKCVNTLVKYVGRFHGKMLRPILVLLWGKTTGQLNDHHLTAATVVEMVHMATLVHDDVLDEAELRRKGATINHLRGNEAAVMLGDYLISHSFHLCSSIDAQSVSRLIGKTTNEVCEGELLQIENRNNFDLDETTYLTIINRKTAALTAASCYLGAQLANASESIRQKAETYGRSLGVAFQIQDDILDIVGDQNEVGKTLGIDIEKAKLTLPIIHFLREAPHEHQALLRSLLQSREPDKVEQIRNLILPSNSIAYARDKAYSYVQKALDTLVDLPESESKFALEMMAQFVINRPK